MTVWSSFCVILGDTPGLTKARASSLGAVHQWHIVDTNTGRSPVLHVDCSNNLLQIVTRSSAALDAGLNGNTVIRYSTAMPATGVKTHVVLQATMGASGHLNAWVNGTQVVNVDCPIGLRRPHGRLRPVRCWASCTTGCTPRIKPKPTLSISPTLNGEPRICRRASRIP